jgi:hypothetical protein
MNANVPNNPAASRRCRTEFDEVKRRVESLSELAALPDAQLFQRVERVSAWSVADHLSHLAKSNTAMADAIRKIIAPGFAEAPGGLTLVGRAVLFSGWIPRGAGRAPDSTRPQVESGDELRREVGESRQGVLDLESALPEIERAKGTLGHFAFGGLTARQWLRVMAIHTRHHLRIIEAIGRSQKAPSK